jgi:hypothetical protein
MWCETTTRVGIVIILEDCMHWQLLPCFLLALPVFLHADEAKKREPVARLVTESGTFLARETPDKPWRALLKDQDVTAEDLLIGLNDAVLENRSKSVQVRTMTDLSNRSPFPIIETALRLHANKGADLDLTLERGRIDVTTSKDKGPAKVIVRFRTREWTLLLEKPGTRIAMEIYGRWPAGSRFQPDKPGDGPLTSVVLVVLKGEVQRSCPLCSVAMTAPPGPAQFGWDSVHGDDPSPRRLDQLPEWVTELAADTPEAKRRLQNREQFRKIVLDRGLNDALASLLDSKEPEVQRIGVFALGAFDQREMLGDLLSRSKDTATWNHAVIALRHWLGRAPGQEQLLYKGLIEHHKYSPIQARLVVELLMGFSDLERARPELYAALISLLTHDKLAIRGLAYWHLQRLAPNIEIAFNPIGTKEEWLRSQEAYRKAIPPGKVPSSD